MYTTVLNRSSVQRRTASTTGGPNGASEVSNTTTPSSVRRFQTWENAHTRPMPSPTSWNEVSVGLMAAGPSYTPSSM